MDAPVSERTLVTYLLNGLSDKYENIINLIMHRQPFPSFDDARSMLMLEEDRLEKGKKISAYKDTSSSDKVLNVSVSSPPQKTNTQPQQQRTYNNNRGFKKNNNRDRGRGTKSSTNGVLSTGTMATFTGFNRKAISGINRCSNNSSIKVFSDHDP